MDEEQEAYDSACWAQQEQIEQRQREDEALERHRVLLAQSRNESAEFQRENAAWHQRIAAQAVNERKMKCL